MEELKMKDIFYSELKEIYSDFEMKKEEENQILFAARIVLQSADLARKEGLLALDALTGDYVSYGSDGIEEQRLLEYYKMKKLNPNSFEKYYSNLLSLIVDGTDCQVVKEYGWRIYFSSDFSKTEKLIYLIFLDGTISIQCGMNLKVLEQMIKALLPEALRDTFCAQMNQIWESQNSNLNVEAEESNQNRKVDYDDHSLIGQSAITLMQLTDIEMQRWLQNIANSDLTVAMKAFPDEVNQKIYSNLSERMTDIIKEDLDYMGPIRMKDAEDGCEQIMKELIELCEKEEIHEAEIEKMIIVLDMQAVYKKRDEELKEKYKSIKEILYKLYSE